MNKCVFKLGNYYLVSGLDCKVATVTTKIEEANIFDLTKNISNLLKEITTMIENGFEIKRIDEINVTSDILTKLRDEKREEIR